MEGFRRASRAAPPAVAVGLVVRPRLEALVAEGARRRLLTVVADAGFGKSTLLSSYVESRACAWYTLSPEDGSLHSMLPGLLAAIRLQVPALAGSLGPSWLGGRGPDAEAEQPRRALAYAGLIADALDQHLSTDLLLVLDDLQELSPGDPASRMVEGLVRGAPDRLHVALLSRSPIPFHVDRLRGRGQVLEIGGSSLTFSPGETRQVLQQLLGEIDTDLAGLVHTSVQGWPAAVRLAGEALRLVPPRERSAHLQRVLRPGGPVFDYLAQEIFAAEPEEVRRLVAVVAHLPRFDPELCQALGLACEADVVEALTARGLVSADAAGEGFRLNPLVRDFALTTWPLSADERRAAMEGAAELFAANGDDHSAVRCATEIGDESTTARLLTERGHHLVASGAASLVVQAAGSLRLRERWLDQLEGEARQALGDWDGAQACYRRLYADGAAIPSGIAWRLGLISHLRGDLAAAVATYRSGQLDGTRPADDAMLQAWLASALWLRGEFEECRHLAEAALTTARACADDRSLAAAHTVLAMLAAMESDPRANAAHYLRALDHAERAGDVLQCIRIRVNRGSHQVAESQYAAAIAEFDEAIRLADLAGFAAFRALALNNRGEAHLALGRLDEAIRDLEVARVVYQHLESKLVAYPLKNLGAVYRERGDLAMARACYEEAVETCQDNGDLQGLVPSLAGLAIVLVEDDPDRAAELVEMAQKAVAYGPVLGRADALLALGRVNLVRGDTGAAAAAADEAASVCRSRRDRGGLADSLELKAATVSRPGVPEALLAEALSIRREIGDSLGVARAQLALASRHDGEQAVELATLAHIRFQAAGATRDAASALAVLERTGSPPLQVSCLGGFRVLRDGVSVRVGDWPSRKARDLLKILVARRCHPVPRSQLVDLLWPDQAEDTGSPRLSVSLSTLRSVLDPEKAYGPDRYVGADRATVWLEAAHVSLDTETFLGGARDGIRAMEAGREDEAAIVLKEAESAYSGDFLEEDVYADWAADLREEARATYVRVVRILARHAAGAGDTDAAATYLLRILQRDPYDERAHLALATTLAGSGAHGEARRAYRTYVARMEELDIEPSPFPSLPV
jgi:ATP/maltotriose-dependent transcriptional regulator MalT/DNA-binding SARP family transcriptional activator